MIDSVIQDVLAATFKEILPEENAFNYVSSDMMVSIQRTTPKRLGGHSFTPISSLSGVTLPEGLLEQMNMLNTDESTVLDWELLEYPPIVSDSGASSAVIDFTIMEAGTYTGSEIQYLNKPKELQIQNLTQEILIFI